jgi:hypothetical protein
MEELGARRGSEDVRGPHRSSCSAGPARSKDEPPRAAVRVRQRDRSRRAEGPVEGPGGAGGGYSWVSCGGCDTGWQVPYYAESVG